MSDHNWTQRTGGAHHTVSAEFLEAFKPLVREWVGAMGAILTNRQVQYEHLGALCESYDGITGLRGVQSSTMSSAGLLPALTVMEPGMVGAGEIEWFRKMARLSIQTRNSMAGRPLDDTTPFTTEQFAKANAKSPKNFGLLGVIAEAIEGNFPQQGMAQSA